MIRHHRPLDSLVAWPTCGLTMAAKDTVTPRWQDVTCSSCLVEKPTIREAVVALRDLYETVEHNAAVADRLSALLAAYPET